MKFRPLILSLLSVLFFCLSANASYRIAGTLNMKGEWQDKIYLSTINKLDDYYNVNAAHIINSAQIDASGYFVLEGDNLPEHAQFYRLYLIKEEQSEFNACLFVGGEEHNFIHLLLDNNSQVHIQAEMAVYAPFGNYTLQGDQGNHNMRQLGALVYPSYIFYEIRFPSELQFSQDKLNRDLLNFADTCSNTLVALAALNNTDFDHYFEDHKTQYLGFAEALNTQFPKHPYTKDYLRKMRYYGEDSRSNAYPWSLWTSGFLAILSLFLLWQNLQLRNKKETTHTTPPQQEDISFTPQEDKILQLIVEGKSNKEIAQRLFVELSTVKSHINKIYSKLSVKKRAEAIKKSKSLYSK